VGSNPTWRTSPLYASENRPSNKWFQSVNLNALKIRQNIIEIRLKLCAVMLMALFQI
jgi:hypothetical protein